jgi:pimeloyl-ACP methyl ester carboxylesterase
VSDLHRVPSSRGVSVALHDLGGGDADAGGPPLLVCHATGFCGLAYRPLAARLRDRFHVWAVDLRGHGQSGAPDDGDFAWDGMADDVLAAVDEIVARSGRFPAQPAAGPGDGSGEVLAFGHSLGGAAVLLAELTRPGTFAAAYLFEPIVWPAGFQHPDGVNPMAGPARRRREVFPSRADALARYASRPPLGELRADCLWAYVDAGFEDLPDGTVRLRCRAESEASTFQMEVEVTVDRFTGVELPVTVAVGQRDGESGPALLAPALVDALPGAQLLGYPHLSHFGPLQDPDTVAADVSATLLPATG